MDAEPTPTDPPSRSPSRSRRRLVRGIAAALTLAALGILWHSLSSHAEQITDTGFVHAADAVCARSKAKIDDRQPPGASASGEERAASVERIAGILVQMARELRALSVVTADTPAVDRWLDRLDKFAAVGPRFAAAIRSGDERHAEDVGNQGDASSDAFNATARANGIGHCVLG